MKHTKMKKTKAHTVRVLLAACVALGLAFVLAGCDGEAMAIDFDDDPAALGAETAAEAGSGIDRRGRFDARRGRRAGGPGGPGPTGMLIGAALDGIDLSAEQRTAIEGITAAGPAKRGQAIQQLHGILDAGQRATLVDGVRTRCAERRVEMSDGSVRRGQGPGAARPDGLRRSGRVSDEQRAERRAARHAAMDALLDAFVADDFDASAIEMPRRPRASAGDRPFDGRGMRGEGMRGDGPRGDGPRGQGRRGKGMRGQGPDLNPTP